MRTLYCSFCGKSQHKVARLIAGPEVYICNECVELCIAILGAGERDWCDRQIDELTRLRIAVAGAGSGVPARSDDRPGWIVRLFR